MSDFFDWERDWPLDRYVNCDIAWRAYPNLYDNDFSKGNCENCFGCGTINAHCGQCYRVEQCMFNDGKVVSLNCPRYVRFTSINGKYLFNETYIKLWMNEGLTRPLYPHDILPSGDTKEGSAPPPEYKDWKNIKFVVGGSEFTMIRGECPKLSAKIKQIYLEQIEIEY